MKETNHSKSPVYEDYVNIFLFTIFFGLIGLLIFGFTFNFFIIFVALITGVLIDMLKLAAKVYYAFYGVKTEDKKSEHE